MGNVCQPAWHTETVTQCPFGKPLPPAYDITWKTSANLSFTADLVCVLYSYVPYAFMLGHAVMFFGAAAVRIEPSFGLFRWSGKEVRAQDLWRIRVLQNTVTFLAFCFLLFLVKWFFIWPFKWIDSLLRDHHSVVNLSPNPPAQSCVNNCVMPDLIPMWATAIFTMRLIRSSFAYSLPLLWDTALYNKEQTELLGFLVTPMKTFYRELVRNVFVFMPVPMARALLKDSRPEQIIVGMVVGVLYAIGFHYCYVWYLSNDDFLFARKFRQDVLHAAVWISIKLHQVKARICCHSAAAPPQKAGKRGSRAPLLSGARAVDNTRDEDSLCELGLKKNDVPVISPKIREEIAAEAEETIPVHKTGFEFLHISTEKELLNLRGAAALKDMMCTQVAEFSDKLQRKMDRGDPAELSLAIENVANQLTKLRREARAKDEEARQRGQKPEGVAFLDLLKGIIEPVVEKADKLMAEWKSNKAALDRALFAADANYNRGAVSIPQLAKDANSVYTSFLECIRSGLDVNAADPDFTHRVEMSLQRWQPDQVNDESQKRLLMRIIQIAVFTGSTESKSVKIRYGDFSFTDLHYCFRLVRKSTEHAFCDKGMDMLQGKDPSGLRSALELLSSLLFFIKYMEKESASGTCDLLKAANPLDTDHASDRKAADICSYVHDIYDKDEALLQPSMMGQVGQDPHRVIDMIRQHRPPTNVLGYFKDIFLQYAEIMADSVKVLVMPHHTQVVTLMAFRKMLEEAQKPGGLKTLIARVGTGEGKSMLIAALAAWIAKKFKKKVHVLHTDERLSYRDFHIYEKLFKQLGIEKAINLEPNFAKDSKNSEEMWQSVWDQDIVYCLKHHLVLLYAKEAKGQKNFDKYSEYILLCDEVDTLVIDEDPNDAIVYPNEVLGREAQDVSERLAHKAAPKNYTPGSQEHKMQKQVMALWTKAEKGLLQKQYVFKDDLEFKNDPVSCGYYANDGNGEPDFQMQSNSLEVLRLYERLRRFPDRAEECPMHWFERLFVMSKPLIFRRYFTILGLSGTLGNNAEKDFFRDAYGAQFMDVPEFLKTCKTGGYDSESSFYSTIWAHEVTPPLSALGRQCSITICESEERQLEALADLAFKARKDVPVLVIARDSKHARKLNRQLMRLADERHYSDDNFIQDLSQAQYLESRRVYNDHLTLSTMRVGEGDADPWRITITDSSGGRGTDYKMSDGDADAKGGLLLILTYIPKLQRDWVQFQGRTARQDNHGQMCAVLLDHDYIGLQLHRPSQADVASTQAMSQYCHEVEQKILHSGLQETEELIQHRMGSYTAGFRTNELCEFIWKSKSQRGTLSLNAAEKKTFIQLCGEYKTLTLQMMETMAKQITGRAPEPTQLTPSYISSYVPEKPQHRAKSVLFLLDVSGSMQTTRESDQRSRLDVCTAAAASMLEKVVDPETDMIGLTTFTTSVEVVMELQSARAMNKFLSLLRGLRPLYTTALNNAIIRGVEQLGHDSEDCYLICLTDGLDSGTMKRHGGIDHWQSADMVAHELSEFKGVLIIITVGPEFNPEEIKKWTDMLGERGFHFGAENDNAVEGIFDQVADTFEDEGGIADS